MWKDQYFKSNSGISIVEMPVQSSTAGLHSHDFHELVIITDGIGTHVTNSERYPISAGDVFVIKPDMAHGYLDTDRLSLINVLYIPELIHFPCADLADCPGYHALFRVEPGLRKGHAFKSRLKTGPLELAEAKKTVREIQDELAAKKPGFNFMAEAHFMRLACFLSRCYTASGTDQKLSGALMRLSEILVHIDSNFRRPLELDALVAMSGMSKSSFIRNFRKAVGRAPFEYIIQKRIERARELLKNPDISVRAAADESGFEDSNYFSRMFKKATGKTPLQFRGKNPQARAR
jgi:AraC family L-rhamnose operon transcriptional activator RhaR/AraC family L-rhamnose operon regulatory protein RhaS